VPDAALNDAPAPTNAAGLPAAEIHGLVDNATSDRLYGWAYNATRPAERVTVELRLGEQVVARSLADFARADLAKAGIGDGCHAFELKLTPECIERRGEIAVVARAEDGTEQPVPIRVRRAEATPGQMQRAVEALVASQRQLREELQALVARLPSPEEGEAVAGLLAAQRETGERLETLMLWLARLDERLAALPEAAPPQRPSALDAWQVVFATVCAGIAAAALAVSVHWLWP